MPTVLTRESGSTRVVAQRRAAAAMARLVLSALALPMLGIAAGHAAPIYAAVDLGLATGTTQGFSAMNASGQVTWIAPVSGNSHAFLYSGGTTTDLGTLVGGTSLTPMAINAAGQVVGSGSTNGALTPHAFLYSGGTLTDISGSGGGNAAARAINDSGQVTGGYAPGGVAAAFRYSGGVMTSLGSLGGVFSNGSEINASGQVAGSAALPNGTAHAFLSSNGGSMTDLGTLGGANSTATAINDSGVVVGNSATATGAVHAMTDSAGVMTDIGSLGGSTAQATMINAAGQVAGNATLANGNSHAFLYSGGVMTDLGTLGGTTSTVRAINASGDVFGTSLPSTGIASDPFLYTGGTMYDVNALLAPDDPLYGLVHFTFGSVARGGTPGGGINDRFQLLVDGTLNGQNHLFLLSVEQAAAVDTPEPASLAVLGVGLLAAGLVAGRRRRGAEFSPLA